VVARPFPGLSAMSISLKAWASSRLFRITSNGDRALIWISAPRRHRR
jgi:hypothetical protein